MAECKPCDTPLSSCLKLSKSGADPFEDPTLYRSTIGALQYLTHTRPDIAFVVNKLSQFLVSPSLVHWQVCKRVMRYLKGTIHIGLWFKPASSLTLEAYSDADWASDIDDRRSTNGSCVFLAGNLISWSSKKQQVVARSSTEAEYRSMANATTELLWLQSLFSELRIPLPKSTVLWCDNIGANSLAKNPVFHARTKHIELDAHFLREKVEAGLIDPCYVPTECQTADIFTKGLARDRFLFLRSKLNLVPSPQFSLRGDVRVCNVVEQNNVPVQPHCSAYSGLAVYKPFDGRSSVNHLDHQGCWKSVTS